MILDGLDEVLESAAQTARQRKRRRRSRIGWRQVTAQVLFVLAVIAFVVTLLLCHCTSTP